MSTFKSVVGSPFYGLGWIGGQVVNGFKAATTKTAEVATATTAKASEKVKAATAATAKAAKSAATKTGEAAKAAATKTGKAVKGAAIKTRDAAKAASQTVASVAVAGAKAIGQAAGVVVAGIVGCGVVVLRTVHTIVWIAAQLAMLAAATVVTGAALFGVAVFCLALIAFAAVAWVGRTILNAVESVGRWLTGPAGLTIANVLHFAALVACFCAACWAIVSVLGIAIPALGVPAAESAVLATAACWAAVVGAACGMGSFMLEGVSSEKVQVVYDPPTRRILPIDVYPGVVGVAPAGA